MIDDDIRRVVVQALRYAAVPDFEGSKKEADFLATGSDIQMSELQVDSLASMELCIAIETDFGVTILPQQLAEISSLNGLVEAIREAA